MRLKSIKLAGFKSFVDPTTVSFPSNMAAVVGPNGCGKSNIIDAVRWVMGESSAKNLRGESMTDVIFNGSRSRKPVGQASIELVFDNSDGTLVGEYAAYSEISIKRIVNREAESLYQLNGSRCRRKDITDIFLGTGLGPRSYAIIEQGMISRLIESKPEELRVFVEEAAGISKYKERRRDTENRIRRTRENLERLTDIRDELERQLQHLKRQARVAERYREMKAEERQIDAQHKAIQWRELDQRSASQGAVIRDLEVNLEKYLSQRVAADTTIEKLRSRHSDQNDAFNAVQAEFYSLGADIARAEQQIQHQREREQQLRQDLQQTQDSLRQSSEHIEHDRERLAAWREELEQIEPELELIQASEDESAELLHSAEETMQQWQQAWDEFNQRAAQPRHQSEVEQSRIQHLDQVMQRLGERLHKLEQESADIVIGDDEEEVMMLQERLAEVEMAAESLEQEQAQMREQTVQFKQQDHDLSAQLNQLRGTFQQGQGRRASLEALQQAALGQDDVTSNWLSQHQFADQPRLADGLSAQPGWEKAVETVLADYLQAVKIDSIDALAEQLADVDGASLAFVDSAADAEPAARGQLVPLATKVSDASGLVAGIYCTEDLIAALGQRAQLLAGESIVTRDGIWLGQNWLRVASLQDEQGGILARQRELEELGAQLELDEAHLGRLEQDKLTAQTALQDIEQRRQLAETTLRDNSREQARLSSELSANRVRVEQALLRRQRVEQETADAREQLLLEEENLKQARQILHQALDAMEADNEQREDMLQQRDHARALLDQARQRARHDKDTAHQLAMRCQSLQTQAASVDQGIERLAGQLGQLSEREESLAALLEDNTAPMDEVREGLEMNLERRLRVEQRLTEARTQLDAIDHEMRATEESRNQAEQQVDKLRGQLEQQRLDIRTIEVERSTLQRQLEQNKFELSVLLEQLPEDATQEQWLVELERMQGKIQRLGPINLAAIDEYQAQAERKHYLDAQNDDLVEALETLENAIHKIDRETRSRFKETFDDINGGLQELFPKVFGGGHAYLELTGDDMLDTGIAIMARPPGKRNSTIHLLSGGEKALTAIALVFAIFRLNPAPFCMLDEVDAPLDDANVGRYARIVKEMSEHVQFIYITHNKITMEYADQLLGVTMHEPGCSRLVSVDIEEAAELAAV
jgi:chromosome segregation protein